ncbi:MAG: hypothetical protein K2J65_10930 [Duncaniella sp.]|nr:hypothetical protein [Duncaniella sp.]
MKDLSLPPYDLNVIGNTVKRLGELTGVECTLCSMPGLKEQGAFSIGALSNDIASIARKYGIEFNVSGDFAKNGKQLQSLIDALVLRKVIKPEDL